MVLTYIGINRIEGFCDVLQSGDVVVVKERSDNTGMSITNAIEQIAAAAAGRFSIRPESLKIYELYVVHGKPELSAVEFDNPKGFTGPSWTPMSVEDFERAHFSLQELIERGDSYGL